MSRKRWLAPLAILAAFAVAAAVGSAASAKRTSQQATLKMAVVTDIGGLNDKGFNQSANAGRLQAQKSLHMPTKVFVTNTAADRLPNILEAARQGYNLIFGTGFFMGDPLNSVAPQFPNTKFAGIDVDYSSLSNHPKNVLGIQFREQEAGYLVGYIAGLVVKYQKGPQVVSGIGANPVPAIVRYLAGYKAGAKKANPKVTVINQYANDLTFSDQPKCKEVALTQLNQFHTQVIFTAAGGCGLGGLSAANSAGKWGIGVDTNQGYLHPKTMLTSALKQVQAAVFQTTKRFKKSPSKFKGGFNVTFSVKNGGVGYAPINKRAPHVALITKKVNAIEKLIAKGKIHVPAK